MTAPERDLHHDFSRIMQRLVSIQTSVLSLEENMTQQLDDLKREVQESGDAIEKAVTFIGGLSDQIRQLKDDPTALEQLATALDAQQQSLAQVMQAPPEPAPEPAPPAPTT